jgi:hypothetical protein
MADITVKGYVNKPATKEGSKGKFSTYTLSEKVKDPKAEKGFRRVYYNVTDFKTETPPEEGSYVTIKGWLKPREFEQNGVKRLTNDIVAQEVDVAPPREGNAAPAETGPAGDGKDPWDL